MICLKACIVWLTRHGVFVQTRATSALSGVKQASFRPNRPSAANQGCLLVVDICGRDSDLSASVPVTECMSNQCLGRRAYLILACGVSGWKGA